MFLLSFSIPAIMQLSPVWLPRNKAKGKENKVNLPQLSHICLSSIKGE